jgi:hypothetical protein
MPTQSPPPYELKTRPCTIRRNQFRWEVWSGGRPLLISHESYRSQSEAEAEGRIELQRLTEKWQAAHGRRAQPSRDAE